jgi:hypothetical protein
LLSRAAVLRRPLTLALAGLAASLLLAPIAILLTLDDSKGGARAVAAAISGPITYLELPEFVADLKTSRARTHYVQLSAVVEVAEDSVEKLQAKQMQILAEVQISLRDLQRQDLAGAAGIARLRGVFTSIIDRHIAPANTHSVLFTKFLVD